MTRTQKWGVALAAWLAGFALYSWTYQPAAGELDTTRRHLESVYHVEFSPDGRQMLWLSDQASYRFDVSDPAVLPIVFQR